MTTVQCDDSVCQYNISSNPFMEHACGGMAEDVFPINPQNVLDGLVGIPMCDHPVKVPLCGEHLRQIDAQPEVWDCADERHFDARSFWREKTFEVECEDEENAFFLRVVARDSAAASAQAMQLLNDVKHYATIIRAKRIPSVGIYRASLMPEWPAAVPRGIRAMQRIAEQAQQDAEQRAEKQAEQQAERWAEQAQRITDGTWTLADLSTEQDILRRQGTEIRYLVQDLVPAERITMLFGPEKSCKSLLAFYIQKCVANGIQVLDSYATIKTPCIYFDREEGIVGSYVDWMSDLGPELVKFFTLRDQIPELDDKTLIKICQDFKPLIVLDSLHKFLDEGKNSWRSDEMEPVLGKIRLLTGRCVGNSDSSLDEKRS